MSRISKIAKAVIIGVSLVMSPIARADQAASFTVALKAAEAKDWPAALTAAQGAGAIGGDVILWQWLRDGQGRMGDYEGFIARRPDWPGLPLLREKGEVAVARSTDPARVVAYFGAGGPKTGAGAVALVTALVALGRSGDAEAEAFRAWTTLKFEAADETAMLAIMGAPLAVAHEVRLDRILWDGGRKAEADRMLPRVSKDWQALARARMALQADSAAAVDLVEAVPKAVLGDPGLAFARFDYRMRADRYDDAATLILERSKTAAGLGDPEAWGKRRADLARVLLRQGEPKLALRVAANHQMSKGNDYVDLEFLSGFIALRKLGEPDVAIKHFKHLKEAVATPISVARAEYWMGRALEAKGDHAGADAAYARAARNQTAYYGMLASEKIGLPLDPALVNVGEATPGWRTSGFAGSSVLAAGMALAEAGDRTLAKRFFLQVAEGLDAKGLEQLADLALRMDEPHIALLVAKQAAERGVILPRAYYPVPAMVPNGLAVSRALALSISRRESEFDPSAQSRAGARGLMQVMPATAEHVAKGLGETSSAGRLISDPPFNVRMGSIYLSHMIEKFGPAVALIASGYNAGPGRPAKWIEQFGDPRNDSVDVVDWVEIIPFGETRTYVMRVAEGVVIYRAKLKGVVGPVRISAELTGR
ncbi:lytic transglycosylase domain-containing protein [Cypionkella sp.]|uniref:lytic transglycosylase domain-containing protein n=1 Tax=Cypionkella sp. TaxID=2811411 RepID=UPI0027180B44|nr:lytic transglycosylase domain-containing protein [Cypionkella sp.]MDO8985012.1 lytic transglycosylase domain-containing protein [Cypionkella sp.]MDP2047431.1 lytic transglycosylase domain-containing protein [Cypionkella sp.]